MNGHSGERPTDTRDPLGFELERMRDVGYHVVDLVVEHWAGADRRPAVREASAHDLADLGGPVPIDPGEIEELLAVVSQLALTNMQHVAHRRYFARVPGPTCFTAILGEWLGVGFNAIASSWAGGSGPSHLELVVVEWLRQLLGFPEGTEGVLVSGGSLGNVTAFAAARHAGFDGAAYVSDQTHSSVIRGLRVLGWSPEQIRVVPTSERYRWTVESVAAELRDQDRGRAIIVATAGTTNTGAVDPLDALADLCAANGLWLHVDGAYGAPAAITAEGRTVLRGLDRADSLTLDPHKWLFQPYDVGCVLVRQPGALESCFAMNPEYLRDVRSVAPGEVDLRNRSLELSRRARAVKLWLTIKTHGSKAISDAIARSLALAKTVESSLSGDRYWEVITPAQLGVITFAARGLTDKEHIESARNVTDEGFAAVSCTELGGRTVYRLCLINPRTTVEDVTETLARLKAAGPRQQPSALAK